MPPEHNPADDPLATVYRYHDGTKHHFHRFAQSLGYLDWSSQPKPFRRFDGAQTLPLYPAPDAFSDGYTPRVVSLDAAYRAETPAAPLAAGAVGDVLRHALGLSAWKRFNASRWALRVNPSSGNLHPTEAYFICGALTGLESEPAVYHYAPDRHAAELRCVFEAAVWESVCSRRADVVFVALTSIHWREAWKYGERAFRYCQHDLGHAIAAISIAAGLVGWRATLLPGWSRRDIAAATGVDRDEDFPDAEREEPACIIALTAGAPIDCSREDIDRLVAAVRRGRWSGRATQLSEEHVEWSFIGEVARATEDPGRFAHAPALPAIRARQASPNGEIDARALLLQRRSAVAFDGRTAITRETFLDMLARVLPQGHAPWTSAWWGPRVHLAVFVHRVAEMTPGLYMLLRDPSVFDRLRKACRGEFLWESAGDALPLWRLAHGDARALAARLSCDQDIAADGFFSLGMLADFDEGLHAFGAPFYRHLFWEAGMVGQVMYLEAEAAGARATGIGCFFDDAVHDVLGFDGHTFQSLYHFTVGTPVDDARLTTEPGYAWEQASAMTDVLPR